MATFAIGGAFGLVAGLVGVAQWALTQRDLAERLAAFEAVQRRYPGFFDATNVDRGNFEFWLGTGALAAVVMLCLCGLAAFTASRRSRRLADGMAAAVMATVISGALYLAATPVAVATSPEPAMTQEVLPCLAPVGAVFLTAALSLAAVGARLGARAGRSLARGHSAL